MEWYYTITSCEKKTLSTSRNETTLAIFEQCIQVYSAKGLLRLIEVLCTYTADSIQWFFHNQSSIIVFILLFLFFYGIFNRRSDTFRTMSDVFQIAREDLLSACMELWSSFKNALISLHRTITAVVKSSELEIWSLQICSFQRNSSS